ncbi:MAG: hypothetical protein E6Q97_17075, partial [Desulfurellales bacterium]
MAEPVKPDTASDTFLASGLKGLVQSAGVPFNQAWVSASRKAESLGLAPRHFAAAAPERLREVEAGEAENPISAIAGRVAGGATAMYLGGKSLQGAAGVAPGWINPASQAAAQYGGRFGAAGKALLAAGAGGVEGAAFSALDAGAEVASREYLATGKVDADHVALAQLEGAKYGFIGGAILGGGLSALGSALPKAGKGLATATGVGYLRRTGVDDPAKVLGSREAAGEKGLQLFDAVQEAAKAGKPATAAKALADEVDAARSLAGKRLDDFRQSLDGADAGLVARREAAEAAVAEAAEARRQQAFRQEYNLPRLRQRMAQEPGALERLESLQAEQREILKRISARNEGLPPEVFAQLGDAAADLKPPTPAAHP